MRYGPEKLGCLVFGLKGILLGVVLPLKLDGGDLQLVRLALASRGLPGAEQLDGAAI